MQGQLSQDERKFWEQNHYLVLPDRLDPSQKRELKTWVEELAHWPETPGQWMKYFERTASDARQLCRVENFLEHHEGLRNLIVGAGTMEILGELMGEEALLFKEKVNYKLPGGAGFIAHQDAPAFASFDQRYHVTMLIPADPMTPENGCIEISDPVAVYDILPQAQDGTIAEEEIARRAWRPLEVPAGAVVFFDSYLPHRSQENRSPDPRRALYVTYNRASEGDRRNDYYAHKRKVFPPECERDPNVDYESQSGPYNLGNPIR